MSHEHDTSRALQPLPRRGHEDDGPMDRQGAVGVVTQPFDYTPLDSTYAGLSTKPVTDAQAEILGRGVAPEEVDIRPDGMVYMGAHRVRQRLNEAFRPGGWGLRQLTSIDVQIATEAQGDNSAELIMSAHFALYAEGRFLASARGEMKYYDNGEMTYGDALEGAKSNALTRCCKDLGIALNLWDKTFGDQWKIQHAVKVWVKGKTKPQWRKLDAVPFYGERDITDDSPNRDKYTAPLVRDRQGDESSGRQEQRRNDPPPAQQQRRQDPPPREREPGEDDDPGEPPPHHSEEPPDRRSPPPRRNDQGRSGNGGGGRTISEAQRRRLYAKAMSAGFDNDSYRDMIRAEGFERDEHITFARYDEIVAIAERGPRRY